MHQQASPISTLIFDVGGVFNEAQPDFVACFNQHQIKLKEDLWANQACHQLILDFCTGKYGQDKNSAERFFHDIHTTASLGKTVSFELFKQAWNAMITGLNHELIDELSQLRQQGYRLFVLSDTNLLHREYLEELYQQHDHHGTFRALFETCYFSHETGNFKGFQDKKSEQAWLQVLTENRLNAHECLYIDDTLKHVQTAEKLGFHGLHYEKINSEAKGILSFLEKRFL